MAKQGIQWGSQRFQGNTQPNWYTAVGDEIYTRQNHPAADENLEATDRGWERVVRYTDSNGVARTKREVVVANRGLVNALAYGTSTEVTADTVASPEITDIRWHAASYAAGTTEVGVVVTFSEPVVVDCTIGIPTIAVTEVNGTGTTAVALSLNHTASGNGTNKLTFVSDWTLTSGDVVGPLDDAPLFISVNGGNIKGALTMYGRGANTSTQDPKRVSNVSSFGVSALQAGDVTVAGYTTTVAADAETKTVA
jgi:hypothetical protein